MRNLNDYVKINGIYQSNFQYKEFVKSTTATRQNIENVPTEKQWQNIETLTDRVLQPVRKQFGPIRITSGFRSIKLCEAIGSNRDSNHARGQAADIEPLTDGVTLLSVIEWIYSYCEFRELIAEYFPYGWVHVAYREGGNDMILRLKDKRHHYQEVDIDYLKLIYSGMQ